MQNAATIVGDHEEAIENTEGHGWNGKEIHGGDRLAMVVQERFPLSASIRFLRSTLHPARDGPLRNAKAELQQLTVNAWRTPRGVLRHHSNNEVAYFLVDRLSASPARTPTPISPKSCPVPTHDGFGGDQNQRILPLRPNALDPNPEQLVEWCQHRSLLSLFED